MKSNQELRRIRQTLNIIENQNKSSIKSNAGNKFIKIMLMGGVVAVAIIMIIAFILIG